MAKTFFDRVIDATYEVIAEPFGELLTKKQVRKRVRIKLGLPPKKK